MSQKHEKKNSFNCFLYSTDPVYLSLKNIKIHEPKSKPELRGNVSTVHGEAVYEMKPYTITVDRTKSD